MRLSPLLSLLILATLALASDWPTSSLASVDSLPITGCRFLFAIGKDDIKDEKIVTKDQMSTLAKIVGEDCFFVVDDSTGYLYIKDSLKSMEKVKIERPGKVVEQALALVLSHCGATYIEHLGMFEQFEALNKTTAIFGALATDLDAFVVVSRVIKDIEGFHFGFTFSQEVMSRLRPGLQRVLFIKNKLTKATTVHEKAFTLEEIMYTLESSHNPFILKFEREDSPSTILGREIPCLFLIDHHTDSRTYEVFQMAANKLRNEISFVHADPESGIVMRLTNFLHINNELGNGLWIIKATWGKLAKYQYPYSEITVENIEKFVQSYDEGKLKRYYHSEEPPKVQNGAVIEAVASTFNELVMDNDLHVFVDYYGTFCGHCHTFAPVFEELANRFSSMSRMRFVKIEMSKNEVENEQIQEFPTLKLYPAGRKNTPIWYGQNRNLPDLIEFIKNSIPSETFEDI